MIGLPRGVDVYLHGEPCDMRRSFNTLTLLVGQKLGKTLVAGDLFVFVAADRKRCKVLYFDGTGLCLFAKRLESGHHFPAPWKMKRSQLTLTYGEPLQHRVVGDVLARQPSSIPCASVLGYSSVHAKPRPPPRDRRAV